MMTEYTYTVTKEWILNNKTDNDSWNAKQLACLCVDCPPRRGWVKEQ